MQQFVRISFVLLVVLISLPACSDFMKIMQREKTIFEKNHPDAPHLAPFGSDSLFYVHTGNPDKHPVVFVHGSPGSWDAYAHLLNDSTLSDSFFLLAYDRPGFGRSAPGKSEYSLQKQALALKTVIDHAGITRPVVLVGHSFGSPIIVRFALDFPDQTQALVNIAGSLDPALEKRRWYNHAASWRLIRWMLPQVMRVSNQELWPLKDELVSLQAQWNQLQTPIYTIQGLTDNLVPAANADFVERITTAAPVFTQRVEKEGHFVVWYKPELVVRTILTAAQTRIAQPKSEDVTQKTRPSTQD